MDLQESDQLQCGVGYVCPYTQRHTNTHMHSRGFCLFGSVTHSLSLLTGSLAHAHSQPARRNFCTKALSVLRILSTLSKKWGRGEAATLQMLLDHDSHHPWPLAVLAEADGSWCPGHNALVFVQSFHCTERALSELCFAITALAK